MVDWLSMLIRKMDCEEERWVEIVQDLVLQSWVSFTLKERE
jgi:hypothetical protein